MKKFRAFYYSALAVIFTLIFSLSVSCAGGGAAKSDIDADKAQGYVNGFSTLPDKVGYIAITDEVAYLTGAAGILNKEFGLNEAKVSVAADGKINTEAVGGGQVYNGAYYAVMDVTITANERKEKEKGLEEDALSPYTADLFLTNIIVYIPAENNPNAADTVMLSANIDRPKHTSAANSDAVSVAAMLETIRLLKGGGYSNNLLFVFSDGGLMGGLGIYAIREKFIGFNRTAQDGRVKFAAAFSGGGNKGGLVLSQHANINKQILNKLESITPKLGADSYLRSDALYAPNAGDFNIFAPVPSVSFANIDGSYTYGTSLDKPADTNQKLLASSGAIMLGVAREFGGADFSDAFVYGRDKLDDKLVYFNFLGLGISYSYIAAYVLGGIMLALLACAVVLAVYKKHFDWKQIALGAAVMLAAVALTFGLSYVLYYIITLMLAGFGVINLHSINALAYSNAAIMITGLLVAIGISMLIFTLLKRFLRVKSGDIISSNVFVWAVTAVIVSFAAPAYSHIFIFTALLQLAAMLCVVLLKDKFKQKTGSDIMRLFPYFIPVILTLPIIFNAATLLNITLGATLLPFLLIVPVSLFGFITPYFSYLDGVLDAVVKRLPPRTVRVQRTFTEKVEDKAKRGKTKEITVTRVVKEKRQYAYNTWAGCVAVILAGIIAVFGSTLFIGRPYAAISARNDKFEFYNEAIVFVSDSNSSTGAGMQRYWLLKDLDLYRYVFGSLRDFKYDSGAGGYIKEEKTLNSSAVGQLNVNISVVSTSGNVKTIRITPAFDDSRFDLIIPGAANISMLKLSTRDNRGAGAYRENMEIKDIIFSGENKDEIVLSGLKGATTIEINMTSLTEDAYTGYLRYAEYNTNIQHFQSGFDEWSTITATLDERNAGKKVGKQINIRGGIQITQNLRVS